MNKVFAVILCSGVVALSAFASPPALARGAAQNVMNSPGYQRALEESRRQRALATQPAIVPVKRSYRRPLQRR